MRSLHEYGCAKDTELVYEQYWQCEECRESYKKIHPAYQTLQQQTFENIHKKKK
jgi:predicted anti-sigma-YlaC factor YlaD